MGGPRRKLSVEIGEQLQHNNAARTKRGRSCCCAVNYHSSMYECTLQEQGHGDARIRWVGGWWVSIAGRWWVLGEYWWRLVSIAVGWWVSIAGVAGSERVIRQCGSQEQSIEAPTLCPVFNQLMLQTTKRPSAIQLMYQLAPKDPCNTPNVSTGTASYQPKDPLAIHSASMTTCRSGS